mgnify:CR=1 FL=1
MSLLKFLGFGAGDRGSSATPGETQTVRKIVHQLESLQPEQARYLASFAYVLGRVANADQVITSEETQTMEQVVADAGKLGEDLAVLVVQIAKSQAQLFGGTEDYLVTREFGRLATPEQKRELMLCLFSVAAADGSIAVSEENEIARIATELKIPPPEMVRFRERFADKLETLRRLDDPARDS